MAKEFAEMKDAEFAVVCCHVAVHHSMSLLHASHGLARSIGDLDKSKARAILFNVVMPIIERTGEIAADMDMQLSESDEAWASMVYEELRRRWLNSIERQQQYRSD